MPRRKAEGAKIALQKIADRFIDTDLLVIGGGIGGCPAAAKAAEHGLNVTLLEKSKLERSGKAGQGLDEVGIFLREGLTALEAINIYTGSGSAAARPGARAYVNPNALYRIFTRAMWALEELERLGVNMRYADGEYGWMPWGTGAGKVGPRVELRVHWQNVKPEMAAGVKKKGVKVIERTSVVDLLTYKGKVVGATAVNTRTGEFIVIKAKAVVLATGDLERHYNPPTPLSWKYKMGLNTCPASSSGDGHAVAYRAGAELTCMEMMRPGTIRDILLLQPGQFYLNDGISAKVFTATGEETILPPGPLEYLELERKGLLPLYQTLEHLPDDFQKRLEIHFADEAMIRLKLTADRGFNPRTHRYQVTGDCATRFNNTGIIIDEDFRSSVPGLYCIGECTDTYGIGAGGTATAGFIVGDNIHKYISAAGEPSVDEGQVESQKQAALAPLSVKDGVEPMEMECSVRQICEDYGGTYKSEGRLREGLRRLGSIRREFLPRLMATNPHYLGRCLEARNIIDLAELHLLASLGRKETRGLYIMLDHLQRDPSLDNKRICQRLEQGKMVLEAKKMPEIKPEYVKDNG